MPLPQALTRDTLAKFLPDQRSIVAFESLFQTAGVDTPAAVEAAQETADDALLAAGAAQVDADAAQATANTALGNAALAQTAADVAKAEADAIALGIFGRPTLPVVLAPDDSQMVLAGRIFGSR